MPHSSGGGFSGGGYHSGSGYSGSGGSFPRVRSSSRYFKNARAYYNYDEETKKAKVVYTNRTTTSIWFERFIIILAIGFIIWGGAYTFLDAVLPPKKITVDVSPKYHIDDQVDSFTSSEEEQIGELLEEFYDQTGIPVTIETISPDTYAASKQGSLEQYAYERYLEIFPDENRWLVVFMDYGDKKTWAFEGMQGNNTDPQLTQSRADTFGETLTKELDQKDESYGIAFVKALKKLNASSRGGGRILEALVGGAIFVFFLIVGILWWKETCNAKIKGLKKYKGRPNPKYKKGNKEKKIDYKPELVSCSYCNGTYIYGETECPYCGAAGMTTEQFSEYMAKKTERQKKAKKRRAEKKAEKERLEKEKLEKKAAETEK